MLTPGTRIGGLIIHELLGKGGMGEVYRAEQIALKRPVAVKRIAGRLIDSAEAVVRFEREAQCIAKVQSVHVVQVHDFGRFADDTGEMHCLLVMELIDGGISLRHVMSAPLAWRDASSLALQAAEGLAAAAEFGVVHRDIKPENIMLTRKGVAKLVDFGLARLTGSAASTDAPLGTPNYMSPEACQGLTVDGRGDLYSLGCTWYHLISGRPPFIAETTFALLRHHVETAPIELRTLVPEVPAPIAELVHACLRKSPAERPASALALVERLAALAAEGYPIPRAVPGLVIGAPMPSEPTTARTQIAGPSSGITLPQGMTPSSAPTLMMGAAGTPRAGAHDPTVITTPGHQPPRRWPATAALIALGVIVIAAMAIAGWAALADARPDPAAEVRAAIDAGDLGLALRRADAAVAADPRSAAAGDAVRLAIDAEVAALVAKARFADAIALIAQRRVERPWLEVDALDTRTRLAHAEHLVARERYGDALEVFRALREDHPADPAICHAQARSLYGRYGYDDVISGLLAAAEIEDGPLDPLSSKLLREAHARGYPDDRWHERLRAVFRRREPAYATELRPQIVDDDTALRLAAHRLVTALGPITPAEELRFHLANLRTLDDDHPEELASSIAWLDAAADQPAWAQRKAEALSAAPLGDIAVLATMHENAALAAKLLVDAFLPECGDRLLAWTQQETSLALRWNAFAMLAPAGRAQEVDAWAFHARTFAVADGYGDDPGCAEAVAYFRGQLTGTRGAEARAALLARADAMEAAATALPDSLPLHSASMRRAAAKVRAAAER